MRDNDKTNGRITPALLLVPWAAVVAALCLVFFRKHILDSGMAATAAAETVKTLNSIQPAKITSLLNHTLIAVLTMIAASGPGEWILRAMKIPRATHLERSVFAAGLGIIVFSLLILAAGLCGFLNTTALLAITIAAAALRIAAWLSMPVLYIPEKDSHSLSDAKPLPIEYLPLALGGAALALVWIAARAPVFDFDSLMYHLAIPKLYLDAGRIYYIPFVLHANWPLTSEMIYTWALAFGGDRLALAFSVVFAALCAASVFVAARAAGGRAAALWAAAALLSMPVFFKQASLTGADVPACFFTVLAVHALLRRDDKINRGMLWLSAVFAGAAAACKLTAAMGVAALAICVFIRVISERKSVGQGFKTTFVFCMIALAVPLPWLIRSYAWTGSPVWPFLFDTLGGKNWNALVARDYYTYVHQYFSPGSAWQDARGVVFNDFDKSAGLAALFLLPLAIAGARRIKRALWVFLAISFAAWLYTSPQMRFLLPALGVFAVSAGAGAAALTPRGRTLCAAGAAALQVLLLVWTWGFFALMYNVALGGQSDRGFLMQIPVYEISEQANRKLPADARVLLMWTSTGYYLDRDYVWGDPTDQGYIDYCAFRDPAAFAARLRELRITHVLFHTQGLQQKARIDEMIRKRLNLTPRDPTVILCAVRAANPLIESGAWRAIYTSPMNFYMLFEIGTPSRKTIKDY